MSLLILGFGSSYDGVRMAQTEDVYVVCDERCLSDAIRDMVSRDWAKVCDRVGMWRGGTRTYTNGTPTGTVDLWEISGTASNETGKHEWCAGCGVLVVHGSEDADGDPYTCEGGECDAPECRELEDVRRR